MSGTGEIDSNLRDTLSSAGLEVISSAQLHHIYSQQVISTVARYEVEPRFTVPIASPDPIDELDRLWTSEARNTGICSDDGKFLLGLPGRGSRHQILHVRDLIREHLPSRIAGVTGSPEFDAVSLDETRLCSASEEEYDFWIVSLTLDQRNESTPRSTPADHELLCDFIAAGCSFQDTISHIRASGAIPVQKMHVMRLLHNQCGIAPESLRLIFSMVDQNFIAMERSTEVENIWQEVIHNQGDDAPK